MRANVTPVTLAARAGGCRQRAASRRGPCGRGAHLPHRHAPRRRCAPTRAGQSAELSRSAADLRAPCAGSPSADSALGAHRRSHRVCGGSLQRRRGGPESRRDTLLPCESTISTGSPSSPSSAPSRAAAAHTRASAREPGATAKTAHARSLPAPSNRRLRAARRRHRMQMLRNLRAPPIRDCSR